MKFSIESSIITWFNEGGKSWGSAETRNLPFLPRDAFQQDAQNKSHVFHSLLPSHLVTPAWGIQTMWHSNSVHLLPLLMAKLRNPGAFCDNRWVLWTGRILLNDEAASKWKYSPSHTGAPATFSETTLEIRNADFPLWDSVSQWKSFAGCGIPLN